MEKNDTNENKLKIYEVGYLLVPTIPEENLEKEVGVIKAAIESKGGSFITEDAPKIRPLAYTMVQAQGSERKKFDNGYFGWIKFEIVPGAIPLIQQEYTKNEHILRFLLIETVRENTLIGQKVLFRQSPTDDKEKVGEEAVEAPKVSEEELDKTIENLVVE